MSSGKKVGADFTCAAVSPKATYAYCAGEDGVVYCFNLQRGDLESFLKVRASVDGMVVIVVGWGCPSLLRALCLAFASPYPFLGTTPPHTQRRWGRRS